MVTKFIIHTFSPAMSMDYTKPLLVPVGSDALGQIGMCISSSGSDFFLTVGCFFQL